MALPTKPAEVADLIRERVAALNTVLTYAYGLSMRVDLTFVVDEDEDEDDEVDGKFVNIESIEQVLDL